tara:strand:+ start:966 stop:1172 length:207 start_codon:yes stop_codon:yes gene_type:complete
MREENINDLSTLTGRGELQRANLRCNEQVLDKRITPEKTTKGCKLSQNDKKLQIVEDRDRIKLGNLVN